MQGSAASQLSACDGFDELLGCLCLRRKLDHELAATKSDPFLVETVESLLAFFADSYQIRLTQNGEVMRNGGLGHIQFLDDLVDREGFAAADVHDLLAGFVRNGFGEEDGVEFHIDDFLFNII